MVRESAADVGYARFYGADDDAAAGRDEEESAVPERGPRGQGRILDELVELTGWHRDYAWAALRGAVTLKVVRPRPGRAPTYGPAVTQALVYCWAVLRAPAGKRLAPRLGLLVPLLRRDGELDLSDEEAALLMRMSAATIERRLAPERARMMSRGRSHTKPGTLLKSQIPIRTWADWDDAVPGFVEIDLVGHEGGNPSGEFCFTLTVTDISTGWTVNRSVRNKASKWVFEALQHVMGVFPFPIIGIDSDNGSEFINDHLFRYCRDNKITPAALSRQILALTGELETLSLAKRPAAPKPVVNRAFNQ